MEGSNANAAELSFRTILVPYDFSAISSLALRYADNLGDPTSGVVHLLHVLSPSVVPNLLDGAQFRPPVADLADAQREVEARLLAAASHVRLPVERFVAFGSPVEKICQVAEQIHADLIVMGTPMGRGRVRLLRSSIVSRTLRCAPCPVFVVRRSLSFALR